ncbi:hypothetical protein EHS13_09645 [Paenibacillus psychroresistens]|uniref:Uncharacterized protein n=1 Tax=Paenibacillus psychroresistens TaxID=1778678 RepID=A0A6B8RG94_9BACL|nr:hypothetical protein [Paenibacillus psychroresistens]QGQ95129.1 hypothetical protein EHS13_09645 [Paenibacillus psychroresistens]
MKLIQILINIGVSFSQSKSYNFSKTSLRILNKRLLPQLLLMRFFSGSAEIYLNYHTPIVRGPYFDNSHLTEIKGKQKNITRSEEWFNKLIQTYEETKSFSLTAKMMNCEPNTVEKYITLYIENNNSSDVFLSTLRVAKGHQEKRLEQIKKTILEFMQKHSNCTRQAINEHIGRADITFLKRSDQEWIDNDFPVPLSRREPNWANKNKDMDKKYLLIQFCLIKVINSVHH